jgi:hypothetical protein
MLPISQKADYRDEAAKFLPYSLRAMQGTLAKTGGIALRLNATRQQSSLGSICWTEWFDLSLSL